MKKRVLLTQPINAEAQSLLAGRAEVTVAPGPDDATIRAHITGCHGLIVRSATRLSRATIMAADCLEVIARTGAGVDNVDVKAAAERGIPVCTTPEANARSVAEHVFAVVLSLAKDLVRCDAEVRRGNWAVRDEPCRFDLSGKTLGLVGFGRIGREAARIGAGFDLKTIAYDPYVQAFPEGIAAMGDLDSLLQSADIVSIHVPLTDSTRGLIDARKLAMMKPTGILVNTSRGGVIDEADLYSALSEKRIAGAALDVFAGEPLAPGHRFLTLGNILLTPHSAALTRECSRRMSMHAVEGVLDVLEGRTPRWVVGSAGR